MTSHYDVEMLGDLSAFVAGAQLAQPAVRLRPLAVLKGWRRQGPNRGTEQHWAIIYSSCLFLTFVFPLE